MSSFRSRVKPDQNPKAMTMEMMSFEVQDRVEVSDANKVWSLGTLAREKACIYIAVSVGCRNLVRLRPRRD
jgi:hypothetical protein